MLCNFDEKFRYQLQNIRDIWAFYILREEYESKKVLEDTDIPNI